jgi:hypothetical protein
LSLHGALATTILLLGCLILNPASARAESAVMISLGVASTRDADLEVTMRGEEIFDGPAEYSSSISVNIRLDKWWELSPLEIKTFKFPRVDLGMSGGFGYYNTRTNEDEDELTITFHSVPMSALGMIRFPILVSDKLPRGAFEPYAGIGPVAFVVMGKVQYNSYLAVNLLIGWEARAGVNVNLSKTLGLYIDYRFTSVDTKLKDNNDDVRIRTKLKTDHVSLGIIHHF